MSLVLISLIIAIGKMWKNCVLRTVHIVDNIQCPESLVALFYAV